jgi:hypothetical protein
MSFPANFNVTYGVSVVTDPVFYNYSTSVEMIIGDLPSVSDFYLQGTSPNPAASKSSLFAFDLILGTLTTTDTYSDPPNTPIAGGTLQIYPLGANIVTIDILITIINDMFNAPLTVPFSITGLGAPINNSVSTGGIFTDTRSVIIVVDGLCLHENSIVHTSNLGEIKIKDLKSDSGAILVGLNGEEVKLVSNIRLANATKFVLIQKGAFGDSPSEDTYIIDGHPIFVNSKEVLPINLINGTTIKYVDMESAPVYTLVTENRTFVLVNGLPICTWSGVDIGKKLAGSIVHKKV